MEGVDEDELCFLLRARIPFRPTLCLAAEDAGAVIGLDFVALFDPEAADPEVAEDWKGLRVWCLFSVRMAYCSRRCSALGCAPSASPSSPFS